MSSALATRICFPPSSAKAKRGCRAWCAAAVCRNAWRVPRGPSAGRSCGLPQCMESAARAIGWAQKRKKFPSGHSHLRRGVGMACTMQGSGMARVDSASAFLKMNEDGSFYLQVGASDVGAGADTVLSQIAAETLGVTLDKVIITSGDTDITPFDVGAYASSTTIISGGAVKKAAGKV